MLADLDLPVKPSPTSPVTLRRAESADLDQLVVLLTDDSINASHGDLGGENDRSIYAAALNDVLADDANDIVVAADDQGRLVGTLQLTRIPGMARRGTTRLLVESVHVSSATRSAGIGTMLMRWVMDTAAQSLGANLVQLTSDRRRDSAHRFYERLGFSDTHIGLKYTVPPAR